MTDDELATKVKAKYPQYAKMDNQVLAEKVKAKYPQYRTTPTVGQRIKGGLSKVGSKLGQGIQKITPDYLKTPMTIPEISGQTGGQIIGDMVGGPVAGMGLGALGGAGGRTIGNLPSALKEIVKTRGFQGPATKDIRQQFIPAAERGATFSAAGEALPVAWRGMKAGGRVVREGLGALEGTTKRLDQLRELPLWEQLKVLMPGTSKSIPTPEVAGAAQERMEIEHGIPTAKQVSKEKFFGIKKPIKNIRDLTVSTKAAEASGATPEQASRYAEALKQAGVETGKVVEKPAVTMARVQQMVEKGEHPPIEDTVRAMREVGRLLGTAVKDTPDYAALSETSEKLAKEIASQAPEYAKARKLTHLANMRDQLMSALPLAPKGDPYRFGVMRLIYLMSSLVAGRFNPLAGALMFGGMAPYAGALGTVGGDVATKALDPILANKLFPALAGGGAAAYQKKRLGQ